MKLKQIAYRKDSTGRIDIIASKEEQDKAAKRIDKDDLFTRGFSGWDLTEDGLVLYYDASLTLDPNYDEYEKEMKSGMKALAKEFTKIK